MRRTIVVIHPHRFIGESLVAAIALSEVFDRIELFCRKSEALKSIDKIRPDCLVISCQLPPAQLRELIEECRRRWPSLPIVMIDAPETKINVANIAVFGQLGSHISIGQLLDTIERAMRANKQMTRVAEAPPAFSGCGAGGQMDSHNRVAIDLTVRQQEILRMIAAGLTSREIAEELCISYCTVKNHVQRILHTLKAKSRTELLRWASQCGLMQIPETSPIE
jgi:DNA-binding NarL/FixJ family response regulator